MREIRKRIVSIGCVLAMVLGLTGTMLLQAEAEGEQTSSIIDGSYLTSEEESVGYDTKVTRGEDLMTGYSKSVRRGPRRLYAGGTTIAAHNVKEVAISVMVERAKKGDSRWSFYTSWQKYNRNTSKAESYMVKTVEGGYYYRVRCTHSANSDVSSSFTNGVFIEK